MMIVLQHLTHEAADVYSLVLSAEEIPHQVAKSWSGWSIRVNESDTVRAVVAIDQYRSENPQTPEQDAALSGQAPRQASWCGVWVACALLGIYLATASPGAHPNIMSTLGASAAKILHGEWFRCITALLIHSSPAHLLGNMVGMAVFGSAVCGIVGSGVGVLMIAMTGIIGNLLNAIFHQSNHLSVGASTAVFGAVGILVAHQVRHRMKDGGQMTWRTVLPIGAGLALLGFLSGGPRVDLMAHAFGMIAGALMSAAYGMCRTRPPSRMVQAICAVTVVAVFIGAWGFR